MFNALIALFTAANIMAVVLLAAVYTFTIISKIKIISLRVSDIAARDFAGLFKYVKYLFWCGTLFIVMDWLLCSSSDLTLLNTPADTFSKLLLSFGVVWAVMIFISVAVEIALKCLKTASSDKTSVAGSIKSVICYSALYFVLSFLIG